MPVGEQRLRGSAVATLTATYPRNGLSRVSVVAMQPRILLTKVKQVELLLTRHRDVDLLDGVRLPLYREKAVAIPRI